MIYIIPKQFNENWDRIIDFIDKLNTLDIKYNPKKNLYPRLTDTNKRGKNSSLEIINKIGSYMVSKNDWLEELCYCLKCDFKVVENNGKKILQCIDLVDSEIFKDHIFCNEDELENTITEVIKTDNIKDIFIDPIGYIQQHINNMSLNETQQLELIKIILN